MSRASSWGRCRVCGCILQRDHGKPRRVQPCPNGPHNKAKKPKGTAR